MTSLAETGPSHGAFGLSVHSSLALPGANGGRGGAHELRLRAVARSELLDSWSGSEQEAWQTRIDGRPHRLERGRRGDHLLSWGASALFHLDADNRRLTVSTAELEAPAWQRFTLDTVLWSVSLLAGFEQLHASAVAGPSGVVAFIGPSGAGKSSVAAGLIVRGWRLFADDIVALRVERDEVVAFPGPPLMNLGDGCGVSPRTVGVALARFGDETWVVARRHAEASQPLAAVCMLERGAGSRLELEQVEPSVRALLPHSLGFPHLKERLGPRFELFSELAEQVPLYRLRAPLSASPAELADMVPVREREAA